MDVINGPPVLGTITIISGPSTGQTFQVTKPMLTIGRDPANDIVLSDASISRHHARIAYQNGVWSISKQAPQNTVSINQRPIEQGPLHDKDIIGLGPSVRFSFQVVANVQQHPIPPAPPVQAVQPVQQPIRLGQSLSPMQPIQPVQNPPFVALQPAPNMPFSTQRAPDMLHAGEGTIAAGIASLEVSTNTDNERHSYTLVKPVINIGRDPSNDIIINRPTISNFHAQIMRDGSDMIIVHPPPGRQKTANGITYKGRTISGTEPFRHTLVRGDVFRIHDEHGSYVTLTYNDGSGATQEIVPEIRPIPLGANILTIGRLPDNNVVLNHPQVSSHHARLERIANGYRIIDLGSTNHTYVGGHIVREQPLKVGDEIRIGPFKLTYTGTQLTQHDESSSIRIDAVQLTRTEEHGKKTILEDISIAIPPRKFVALVGGSGAGKSTLMNALNGLRPAQSGTVLYNGQDYYHNLAAFSTQLGYVPQDDIIHRDLTVERALYYAAKLRLPSDFTEQQIKERVEEVLDDVEMKFRRNTLVSKLSGGQRKRVSIALELLANPNVFFLDEPTSGLDPGLDRKMMLLLRRLADKGRTIVLVTHATNNINSCDYVCFLCRGGRMAYFGPPDEAKKFFGKSDFAEIYSALEPPDDSSRIPEEAEERFRNSPDYQRYVEQQLLQGPAAPLVMAQQGYVAAAPLTSGTTVTVPERGNPWKQFSILSARYLELIRNDFGNLLILLLQAPVIGLVLLFLTSPAAFAYQGNVKTNSVVFCPPAAIMVSGQSIVYGNCQSLFDQLSALKGQYSIDDKQIGNIMNGAVRAGGSDAETTLLIMAFAAVAFGCLNGAREFVKEEAIYKRERSVNLGIIPYMFSKIVVLGVFCLIQSLILTWLVSLRAPFYHSTFLPAFAEIYITMALASLAGLMVGLTVSALVPNNDRAMSVVPLVLLPQLIFSGIIFPLGSFPLQFIGAFFPARWAMMALGSTVGIHNETVFQNNADTFTFQGTLFSNISKTQSALHILLAWFFLAVTIVGLGFLIGYFLRRKDVRG